MKGMNTWSYDDICHPCDVNHRPTPKSDQLLKIGFGWGAITAYIDATNVKEQLRPKNKEKYKCNNLDFFTTFYVGTNPPFPIRPSR